MRKANRVRQIEPVNVRPGDYVAIHWGINGVEYCARAMVEDNRSLAGGTLRGILAANGRDILLVYSGGKVSKPHPNAIVILERAAPEYMEALY